jgi:hypothetical protein
MWCSGRAAFGDKARRYAASASVGGPAAPGGFGARIGSVASFALEPSVPPICATARSRASRRTTTSSSLRVRGARFACSGVSLTSSASHDGRVRAHCRADAPVGHRARVPWRRASCIGPSDMSKPNSSEHPDRRLVARDADASESAPADRILHRLLGAAANDGADDARSPRRAARSRRTAAAGRGDRPAGFPFSLWKSG